MQVKDEVKEIEQRKKRSLRIEFWDILYLRDGWERGIIIRYGQKELFVWQEENKEYSVVGIM